MKQEQSFDGLQIQNSVIVNSQEIRPPSCSSGEEAADLEPRPFQRHCSLRTAVRRRNSAPRRMALSAGNTPKIQFKTNPVRSPDLDIFLMYVYNVDFGSCEYNSRTMPSVVSQ